MPDPLRTPLDTAVLDRRAFPHIFQAILIHAPAASLLRLRATCRALRDWADSRLAPDLTLTYVSSSRGVVATSSTGFRPHFPTPVLRRTASSEWPEPANSLFRRVLAHTSVVDLAETFPPKGLAPLPCFLTSVKTVRITVDTDGWSEIPHPPDLSGPILAPEVILLGPNTWATMPGVRIPHGVERLVVNSPLHSPVIALDNVGRPSSLREAVFIFNCRTGLDRSDPDFELKQQHQALSYSVAGMLAAATLLEVTIVNLAAVHPMTLGIATAEMVGRTLQETFEERVRLCIRRQLGDHDPRDRVRFFSLDEYAATRTRDQLALEVGDSE